MTPYDNVWDDQPSTKADRLGFKELYEKAQGSTIEIMKAMKEELKDDHIDHYIRLHNILLGLQHWRNDIRPKVVNQASDQGIHAENYDVLLALEKSGPIFSPLAETVQDSFVAMIWSQRQLQAHFKDLSQDKAYIHIIEDLEGQVNGLRGFINPLRTLYEVDHKVGKVAQIAEKAASIEKGLAKSSRTPSSVDIPRPGAAAPIHPTNHNCWAILVGIDQYKYPTRCLSGCVRDVTHASEFLKSQLQVPSKNITMLTAPIGSDPRSPARDAPTKKNVIEALEKLEDEEPGAFVYFHYSGHGARRATKYRDLKRGREDETFCTWQEEITDVELGDLLELLAKKHTVLAVLDSCHSGGADGEDLSPDDEDIRSANHASPGLANRGTEGDDDDRTAHPNYTSPLYRDRKYNLIAACHPNEKAKECLFPAKTGLRRGALSYFLLQALKPLSDANGPVTYRHLQEVIVSQLKADPRLPQNPLCLGKQDRIVFATGTLAAKSRAQANVISKSRDYVTLNRGSSLQVANGDKFLLYPPSQTTLGLIMADDSSGIEVQITTVDQLTSTAVLVHDSHSSLNIVESGWFARLSTRSSRKIVHLQLPPGDDSTTLGHLRDFRASPDSPFELKFTAPEEDADFTVQIDEDDNFNLQDKAKRPITNLPLISAYDDTSVKQLTGLLDHLSSYQLLVDMAAPLGQSLPYTFRLEKTGRNELKPPSLDGWRLCFKNNSAVTLYVTILGLSPAYGISEMYPGLFESSSELAKGKQISPDVIVDIVIPPLLATAKDKPCFRMSDRFKVLITREPVNFEDYLLPDLNKDPAELEEVGKSRAEARAPQFSPWDVHDAEIITQRLDDGGFITYDASNPPDDI